MMGADGPDLLHGFSDQRRSPRQPVVYSADFGVLRFDNGNPIVGLGSKHRLDKSFTHRPLVQSTTRIRVPESH